MKYRTLVRRAALGRSIRVKGSFATNTAAEDLERLGTSALDEIESFFRSDATRRDLKLPEKFLGVMSVMMVYLRLGADWDPHRTAEFVKSLPVRARADAVRASLVRWGPASAGNNGAPPEPLRMLFQELTDLGTSEERVMTKKLMKNFSGTRKSRSLARR
jgi:hypothetical protein